MHVVKGLLGVGCEGALIPIYMTHLLALIKGGINPKRVDFKGKLKSTFMI